MKRIIRMIFFSAIAIYLTSLWNQGFIVNSSFDGFIKTTLIVGLIYYLILPIVKILLLPLNFLTLGFASLAAYILIFYFFINHYGIIQISAWEFNSFQITYGLNVILAALSVSIIISLIDNLL